MRITQAWPETPPLFRDQFFSIFSGEDLQEDVLDERFLTLEQVGNWLASRQSPSSEELISLSNFLFQLGEDFRQIRERSKVVAIRHQLYSEQHLDRVLKRIKDSIGYDPRTGHDHHSRRSFLGTADQWDKFLAWEANGQNAYRAAAEFLPLVNPAAKRLRGHPSRSERQRDIASSIRHAKDAILRWIDKIYPEQDLIPSTLRRPKTG